MLSEIICFVLEIPLSSWTTPSTIKKLVVDWKPSQSIHSIFLFLEDRLPKSNNIIGMRIPQTLHPENLIRLFRRRIQDAPFPHLLRLVLHKYKKVYINSVYISRSKGLKKLLSLLWNFYIYQMDSKLLFLNNQVYDGQQPKHFVSMDRNSIIRKERQTPWYEYQSQGANIESCLTRFLSFHYGRYRNHSILAIGGTPYFAKKYLYFILILFENNSCSCIESNRFFLKRLSKNCFLFLGYNLAFRSIVRKVRVDDMEKSYSSTFVTNQVLTELPITLMVKLTAKKNSCDNAGHPMSKSAWVTLPDDDILKRFAYIWKILSIYYGGSTNRNGLRRLKYILRFSCDNTLACKHKSKTRSLQRKFESETFLDNCVKSNQMSPFSNTPNLSNDRRCWCLNVIRPIISTIGTLEIQI